MTQSKQSAAQAANAEKQASAASMARALALAIARAKPVKATGRVLGRAGRGLKNWFVPTTLEHIPAGGGSLAGAGYYAAHAGAGADSVRELKKVRWDRILAALGATGAAGAGGTYILSGGSSAPINPSGPAAHSKQISPKALAAIASLISGGTAAGVTAGIASAKGSKGEETEDESEDTSKKSKSTKQASFKEQENNQMNMDKELVKLAFRLGFETAQQAKQAQPEQALARQEKTAGQKLIEQYGAKIQAQKQAAEAEAKKQSALQLIGAKIQAKKASKASCGKKC